MHSWFSFMLFLMLMLVLTLITMLLVMMLNINNNKSSCNNNVIDDVIRRDNINYNKCSEDVISNVNSSDVPPSGIIDGKTMCLCKL